MTKKNEKIDVKVTFKLPKSKVERLDKFAQQIGINRSQLVRNLVDNGLDDLSFYNSLGMMTLALGGKDLFGMVKKAIKSKKFKIKDDKQIIIDVDEDE